MTDSDQQAILAKMQAAQEAYTGLIADLAAGRIDEGAFRRAAVPLGLIITDREVWIMDATAGRWLYYDGMQVRDLDA